MKKIIAVLLMGILATGILSGCETDSDRRNRNNADLIKSTDKIIDKSHKKIKTYNDAQKLMGN